MCDDQDLKNVFEEILEPIDSCVDKVQGQLINDYLSYKLSFTTFTTNILYAIICQIKSIGQLIVETNTSPSARNLELPVASKSMYSEAFSRYSPEMYRKIFTHLLNSCNFLGIPEISHLGQILLIDGSLFPAISTMTWAKYKKGSNSIKMHLAFELNRMIPVQFLATEGNYSEKQFLLDIIEKGVTYVCDRGYISFKVFFNICQKEAYFIIRGKSNMIYKIKESIEVKIPVQFSAFFESISDTLVIFSNDSYENTYRIVKFIAMGESYVLISNRFKMTTYEIIVLYAYRWQVELCFRYIKRTLKGIHLMSHGQKGIQIQFYLYMIAYLLLLLFKQKCEGSQISDGNAENFFENKKNTSEEPTLESHVKKGNDINDSTSKKKHSPDQTLSTNSSDYDNDQQSKRCYARGIVSLLGKKLQKLWKISKYWLIALKNLLIEPYNKTTIQTLSGYS